MAEFQGKTYVEPAQQQRLANKNRTFSTG